MVMIRTFLEGLKKVVTVRNVKKLGSVNLGQP
jgi:hypothetical protein